YILKLDNNFHNLSGSLRYSRLFSCCSFFDNKRFIMVTRAIEATNLLGSNFDCMQYDELMSQYQKEWDSLFSNKYYLEKLKLCAMKGTLKSSHFRSICWKIFLHCLPEDKQMWIEAVKSQRKLYEEIMDKFDTNPRDVDSLDITVNNPLSQSQQSPWNQYFQDTELKVTIQQDVVRTFPEIEFFHTPNIQKMMINILFSYAREFPELSYKQGMHELLAPIIFVLHYDQQAYLQASETGDLDLEIHILLNQNYIEHDAFFMFSQLMESVEAWYTMADFHSKHMKHITAEPFSQSTAVPSNLLGRKLKRIYEQLLKHHDTELFLYFEQMEITPQIFGIRWLRLLFGREFSIHDLLIIWDAIFADSNTFELVDHVFVAMLISIRELLLQGDYASCLNYLMHFPNVVDVHYIVNLALHLRDPDCVKRPEGNSANILNPLHLKTFKNAANKSFSKNSPQGAVKTTKDLTVSNKHSEARPKSLSIAGVNVLRNKNEISTSGTQPRAFSIRERILNAPSSDPDDLNNSFEFFDSAIPYTESKCASFTLPRTHIRNVMENRNHKFRAADISQTLGKFSEKNSTSDTTCREMVPLVSSSATTHSSIRSEYPVKKDCKTSQKEATEEIKFLKSQISELKLMNEYCTQEITQNLEKLQGSMMRQSSLCEDDMFIALAGIKRARDILKGTVNFTEEVLGNILNPHCVIPSIHSKSSHDISPNKPHEHNHDAVCSKNCSSSNDTVKENMAVKICAKEDKIESIDCAVSDSVIKMLNSKSIQEHKDSLSDYMKKSLSIKSHSQS
ncbi:TBC1 domain family member 5, partial [Trichonephila clavata]